VPLLPSGEPAAGTTLYLIYLLDSLWLSRCGGCSASILSVPLLGLYALSV
jgi:hypothetical protein